MLHSAMMARQPRWFGAVTAVVTFALVLIVLHSPGFAAEAADPSLDDRNAVRTFHWESPQDLDGTFTAILRLESHQRTRCAWETAISGHVNETNPILLWSEARFSTGALIRHTVWNPELAHAHGEGVVDTRTATVEDDRFWTGNYAAGVFGTEDLGRTVDIQVSGFGLHHVPEAPADHSKPFIVDLQCDDPVDLTLMGGTHGRGFTHQALTDDGAGISIEGLGGVGDVIVSRDSQIEVPFETPEVRFRGAFSNGGGQVDGTTDTFRIAYPSGDRTWRLPDGEGIPNRSLEMAVTGGPGDYSAHLNLTRVGEHNHLFGIFAGVRPVQSLSGLT